MPRVKSLYSEDIERDSYNARGISSIEVTIISVHQGRNVQLSTLKAIGISRYQLRKVQKCLVVNS